MHLLVFVGRISDGLVESLETPVDFFIGVVEDMVGSFMRYADWKAEVGLGRMEGKYKNQVSSSVGDDLFIRIEEELLGRRGGKDLMLGSQVDHHLIPKVELSVAKVVRIHQ